MCELGLKFIDCHKCIAHTKAKVTGRKFMGQQSRVVSGDQ